MLPSITGGGWDCVDEGDRREREQARYDEVVALEFELCDVQEEE